MESRLKFTGSASEYFGIWIVNVLLTIATLGIYSAWAKVRKKQYFYGNTLLLGDRFAYHATGRQILRGRLFLLCIAILFLLCIAIVSYIFSQYSLIDDFLTSIIISLLWPYAFNRSRRFNARMSSWRNVHFNWHGTYGSTAWVIVIYPFLVTSTLGLLLPKFMQNLVQHTGKHYSLGSVRFAASCSTRPFYMALLQGLLIILSVGVAFVIFVSYVRSQEPSSADPLISIAGIVAVIVLLLGFYFAFNIFWITGRKVLLENLVLGEHARFASDLNPYTCVWIVLSNMIAILLSMGLLIPWASVRLHKYQVETTSVITEDDGRTFMDTQHEAGSALGSEFTDIEGMDIDLLS